MSKLIPKCQSNDGNAFGNLQAQVADIIYDTSTEWEPVVTARRPIAYTDLYGNKHTTQTQSVKINENGDRYVEPISVTKSNLREAGNGDMTGMRKGIYRGEGSDLTFTPVIDNEKDINTYAANQGAGSVNLAMNTAGLKIAPAAFSLVNPLSFTSSMAGGLFFDEAAKAGTNSDGRHYTGWGDMVHDKTGLNETVAEFTNPGYALNLDTALGLKSIYDGLAKAKRLDTYFTGVRKGRVNSSGDIEYFKDFENFGKGDNDIVWGTKSKDYAKGMSKTNLVDYAEGYIDTPGELDGSIKQFAIDPKEINVLELPKGDLPVDAGHSAYIYDLNSGKFRVDSSNSKTLDNVTTGWKKGKNGREIPIRENTNIEVTNNNLSNLKPSEQLVSQDEAVITLMNKDADAVVLPNIVDGDWNHNVYLPTTHVALAPKVRRYNFTGSKYSLVPKFIKYNLQHEGVNPTVVINDNS